MSGHSLWPNREKVTDSQCVEIVRLNHDGMTYEKLAFKFGICAPLVRKICTGLSRCSATCDVRKELGIVKKK